MGRPYDFQLNDMPKVKAVIDETLAPGHPESKRKLLVNVGVGGEKKTKLARIFRIRLVISLERHLQMRIFFFYKFIKENIYLRGRHRLIFDMRKSLGNIMK